MQNALRKWLVGFGLVAALLALAVPALAQNQWQAQTAPAGTFPTPVTAMNVGPLNQVEAVTAGGGYPGGNLGLTYYDNAGGTNFAARTAGGDPPGDDYTCVMWDGTWWFGGAWATGLWDFNGAFTNPTATAPLWVNKHVQCFAADMDNAGAPYPHVIYIGSWGDGMYTFDGTTWTKLANYPGAAPAQFVRKVMLVQNGLGVHPDVYAATDGYGLVKGVWTGATWSWTQASTADLFVTGLGKEVGGDLFMGTKSLGIYESSDNGATWGAEASVPVITMPVTAVIDTAVGLFAGTAGQGIYRKDEVTETWYRIDTAGCAGGATVDPFINDLAFETAAGPVYTLFAGAGQEVAAGVGHVYSITLANPACVPPATQNLVVGTPYSFTLPITEPAVCSPKNWKYQITGGALPPGLGFTLDNTPTPPTLTISGTPTMDCNYSVTVRVWDALYNYVDITINFAVQLMAPPIVINVTPTPLGSVQSFSTLSPAALGAQGTLSYAWNFGDGAAVPAVDSTSSNPTHIYTGAGAYTVTLVISDSACPGGTVGTTCPATPADNCSTATAEVYAPLLIDPTATIVGSGSQFQFHPASLFPMGGLPVCTKATNSGICPPPDPDPSADGYSYDWRFYNVPPVGPPPSATPTPPPGYIAQSCDSNPIVTFSATGGYWAWLHVSDCSGHDAYAYCVVNYNGPMSVTFSSNTNPAPTGYSGQFTGTAQGCGVLGNFTADIDFGDGIQAPIFGMVPTGTVPAPYWVIPWNYSTPGTYTVTFTVHDDPACGHTTVVQYRQTIYPAFTGVTVTQTTTNCTPGYPNGPVPKQMCFNVTPVGGLPPYMISVDWGDGSVVTVTGVTSFPYNICHTYATAGTYNPFFYMTDSGAYPVTLGIPPDPPIQPGAFNLGNPLAGTITPACQSVLQPLAASVTLTLPLAWPSPGFAYTDVQYYIAWGDSTATGWINFAGQTAIVPHNYPVLGGVQTYNPQWYLRNTRNCEQIGPFTGAQINIYNALAPLATPTWTQDCGSRTLHFTATAPTTGVPPYTYKWDFNDGTLPYTTPGPTTTHTFAANGNYNCQLTVNDSAATLCGVPGNQTQNVPYLVQVLEPISGTISGPSGTLGCAPQNNIHFTSSMAGGGLLATLPPYNPNPNLAYTWSVSPAAGVTIAPNGGPAWETWISFANPGTYTISLSVTSTAIAHPYTCSASNSITVTVIGGIDMMTPPTFTVTETSGYLPLPDTFTSTFAVTDPSADVTLTYSFLKNGNNYQFPVTDPATTQPGTFVAPNNYVIHPATTFMNNTFTFVESGTYTVTMTLSDSCGNTTAGIVKVIQILEPQALSVTTQATPSAGNAPLTVTFASFPTGGVPQAGNQYIYNWDFGDGGTSTAQNPTHIYAAPGTYTATLTVTDYYPVPVPPDVRHTAQATVTITVYAGMTVVASATTPTSGSKPLSVTFAATPTGGNGVYSYLWYFGDGSTGTTQNPTHVYNNAGTYFAYVVVNDTASHTATSNQVVVNAYDPLTLTANATPSAGNVPLPVTFTAQANGGDNNYTYTWNFGDGSPVVTGALVNHTFTTAGASGTAYTVTVTVVDGVGHTTNKTLTVTAYQPMVVKIKANALTGLTPFNPGFALDGAVTGGDGAYTYLWNFGDGTSSNLAAPTKSYSVAGTYTAWLTVSDGAGHSQQSNSITVKAWDALTLAISANPATLIGPGVIQFTANVAGGDGNYTVAWTFGDGGTGSGTTVNHTYAVGPMPNFTYTVTAVATDGIGGAGHTATKTMTVTVKPVPPTITQIEKLVPPQVESFRLRAFGVNFQPGCVATINGTAVTTTYKTSGQIILKNCKSLCPKNVPVTIVVTNPDGGVSAPFTYVRTQTP